MQVLTTFGALDYRQLNFISLGSVSAATAVAFALPPIERTVYFHRAGALEAVSEGDAAAAEEQPLRSEGEVGGNQRTSWTSLRQSFVRIRMDFLKSFGNAYVLKWSLWWALGMCGNFQARMRSGFFAGLAGQRYMNSIF